MKSIKYVFHGISNNPKRYILGILSVIIAALLMVFMGVIFSAGQGQIRMMYTTEFDYDFTITQAQEGFNITYFETEPVIENISSISGIEGIYPVVSAIATVSGDNATQKPAVMYGAEESYQAGTVDDISGEYDLSGDNAVISYELAVELSKDVGDYIDVIIFPDLFTPVPHTYTISGIINLTGRFYPPAELYIITNLEYLQTSLGLEGKANIVYVVVDQSLYDMDNIADPAGKVIEIGNRISSALGPEYRVDSFKAYLLKASFQGIGFFSSFIYIFSIIFPAIAGIMVASILNLSVEEKAQDLAVLRLLGAKRVFVAKVIFIELLIMLVIGLPTGVFFGMILSLAIVGRFFTGATLSIMGTTILLQVVTTLLVLLLFSLKPILKAFHANPIDAVRRVKTLGVFKFVSTQGIDKRIFVASLIFFLTLVYSTMIIPTILIFSSPGSILTFLIMSILLILVSLCVTLLGVITHVEVFIVRLLRPFSKKISKLIGNNIRRYSRRNLSTNVIFGIIVAIMIFFSTFISAIQVSAEDNVRYLNGSDIRVYSLIPMPMFRVEQIESITGVDKASPVTSGVEASLANLVGPSGRGINLYGVHPDFPGVNYVSNSDFHKGDVSSFEELTNSSIIIPRQLADDLEVDLGDRVVLDYEGKRVYVTITAVLKSMPGYIAQVSETWGGTQACFISIELYAFITSQQESDLGYNNVFVKVKKGFDHEEVGRSIKNEFAVMEGIGVSVTEVGIRMTVQSTSMLQLIFTIILTSLLLVAIFSLITNLYASIIEREYEIGVLKALGFRNSDILQSLLIEGLVIALASVLIGLIAGITVGFMVIYWLNILSPVNLIFWVPEFVIIYLLIASIVSSILATYLTANSVSKKPIINLMRRIE